SPGSFVRSHGFWASPAPAARSWVRDRRPVLQPPARTGSKGLPALCRRRPFSFARLPCLATYPQDFVVESRFDRKIRFPSRRARRAGIELPLGERLHALLVARRGAPVAPLWRGETPACPSFVLNLAHFADPEHGFDGRGFAEAVQTAVVALTLAAPAAQRIAV